MSGEKSYPDFVDSTGYGTGGGLCGWNCRHNFIPFDPETMKNNLPQYGLEENKKMYENHQKQRYFERNIRKYKRLVKTDEQALEHVSDDENRRFFQERIKRRKLLLKKYSNNYKEFSKANNLRTQPERLKIAK